MKQISIEDVDFTIEAECDDVPVRGNAIMSGDDAFDKKVENEILERLIDGDVWAWASVKVTGTYRNILKASDYLGCCSYANQEDFTKDGYYDDMRQNIVNELNDQLQKLFESQV